MSNNKKYYWLRLKCNFFNNKEVKKLRKIAGGDTFTIIYLKMQLLSIKNGGLIKFEKTEDDLAEQLSLELDEEYDNVKVTLSYMVANNLIEDLKNDEYLLPKVPPLIGSETDAAERMRKMRERNNVTLERNNVIPMLQSVTQSKSKEIKLDKNTEVKKEWGCIGNGSGMDTQVRLGKVRLVKVSQGKVSQDIIPYSTIIDYLNSKLGSKYKSSTRKTKDFIKARFNEGFTLEDFTTVIDKKITEWKDTEFSKYLRPETLFGNKFEGYLNQKNQKKGSTRYKSEGYTVDINDYEEL